MTDYVPTTAPLKNGIVRLVRADPDLKAALIGGIHERVAPRKVPYPFMVFSEVSAPFFYSSGGRHLEIHALFDITVFALKKVEAQNLDMLLARLFSSGSSDVDLQAFVTEQRVILCHRTANTPTGPERDDVGNRVVQFGGQYEIWSDQPIPTV